MKNHISFYRKWRPQGFDEVIGQDYLVKTLKNAVSKNRLSHAYIFCGPRGTGKTSTARILAKALNCKEGPTSKPCNKCEQCKSIIDGSSVDVIEIDAASNRGINEIRELRERVKYLPTKLRKKVYIIDEVHMLTPEAFNALLKVLEEPPEHVIFILATTEPNKVIATIMSRCQRFDFYPIPIEKIINRLKNISRSENISISDSAINMIAKYSEGSLRDADGMLEQLSSFSDTEIKTEEITHLFGLVDFEVLFEFADILIEKDIDQAILFSDRLLKSIQNLSLFTTEFIEHLYNLFVIKNYENPFDIIKIGDDYRERLTRQAKRLDSEYIEYYIDLFSELHQKLKWGEGYRTFFKTTIIKAIKYDFLDNSKLSKELVILKKELEDLKSLKKPEKKDKEVKVKDVNKKTKRPKQDIKGPGKNSIKDQWEEICMNLKEKNISLNAMFVEVESFTVNGKNIVFYLEGNKKWHKDHLNKQKNTATIIDILKEITGNEYLVKFELRDGKERKDEVSLRSTDKKDKPDKISEADDKRDEIEYLEKKFGIEKGEKK